MPEIEILEKTYKIVAIDGGKYKIKEIDQYGSTKRLLDEEFANEVDASDFISKINSGSVAPAPAVVPEPKSEMPRADQLAGAVADSTSAPAVEPVLKKYKVLGEIIPLNEDGSQQDTALEIDSVQEVPEAVGAQWVVEGLAEEVTE